ncbi:ATP-binding protein [Nonomuraea sp. NPDC049158]|uniref:sensor histidine kinase n=1 Tax=Nonomuraea sp. NPDC049158 TaxID=3155649 RepID=UPI0033E3FCA1
MTVPSRNTRRARRWPCALKTRLTVLLTVPATIARAAPRRLAGKAPDTTEPAAEEPHRLATGRPRRPPDPVAVRDVLRSALSAAGSGRAVLGEVDDALLRGTAVAEIAHLVTELVDNALTCSPPDTEVEIRASTREGECHIAIVDQGVGMTEGERAAANARLRGERRFFAAPTRYLGHYVVGRLAERLGVRVWLDESPPHGITARVALPGELLVPSRVNGR